MRINELQCKDVVNVCNGEKLGFVTDLILSDDCLCVDAIIVSENKVWELLNIFQAPQETVISMCQVVNIGEDVILVNVI